MKKVIIGGIIGASLVLSTSAYAETAIKKLDAYINPKMKLTVDGGTVALTKPIVTIGGSSYMPVAEISKLLGKNVAWNEKTKTIELSAVPVVVEPTPTPEPTNKPSKPRPEATPTPTPEATPKPTATPEPTPVPDHVIIELDETYGDDGIHVIAGSKTISLDGTKYVPFRRALEYHGLQVQYDNATKTMTFTGSPVVITVSESYDNTPEAIVYKGASYLRQNLISVIVNSVVTPD